MLRGRSWKGSTLSSISPSYSTSRDPCSLHTLASDILEDTGTTLWLESGLEPPGGQGALCIGESITAPCRLTDLINVFLVIHT